MPRCVIVGCNENGRHTFPNDPKLKKLWEKATKIKKFKASKNSRLCSKHFKESDYQEICATTGLPPLCRHLKKGVVPSIFPWTPKPSTSAIERQNRYMESFPKNLKKRQNWLSSIPLKGKFYETAKICSLHFKPEDYDPSRPKRLLITAVPVYSVQLCSCGNSVKECTTPFMCSALPDVRIKTKTDTCSSVLEKKRSYCEKDMPITYSENIVEDSDICDDIVEDAADDSDTLAESNVEEAGICDDNMDDAEDNTNTLVESNVCRVCLAMDVKMYDLKDTELRGMFQNVTGICVPEKNHSILERLCWECVGRLKTAAAFRNKALLSDTLLQGLASTGEQIRKNDITTIKENKEYLSPAGTLSVVEVFHPVDIDPENESVPHILENNDTNIVEHTVGKDSYELKNKNIIDEDSDQTVIEDEPMIDIPIKTETEYDQFDYLCPKTGEESRNVFTETNPLVGNDISLRENIINLSDSSPLPGCSHADPKYPVVGSLQNTRNNYKIKRNAIVINKKDLNAKIVFIKPKMFIGDKSKNINVTIGGVSKKILIINKVTKTQVNTHTGEE